MNKNNLLSLFFVFCITGTSYSQGTSIPLNTESYDLLQRLDVKYSKILPVSHMGVKPYSRKFAAEYAQALQAANIVGNKRFNKNLSYLYVENSEWLQDTVINSRKAFWRFFYREPADLYSVRTGGFILKINPVLHFELGKQKDVSELKFINTRGIELRGYIKKKVGFYFFMTDNQQRNMSYMQSRIIADQAVPGEGYYKDFRANGVDYFTARGYVVFNILGHIDVKFGHDKNFFGNGIRSLFLSDYGANYFFLKLETTIWRIKYTNLFTELTSTYTRGADRLLDKKYGVFHHLNVSITHWLDIGFFEAVMYSRSKFEFQYLNPIIFYRAIEQSLGSPDNAVIGIDYKANFARRFQLYGQFLFDEFNFTEVKSRTGWWANKFAIQTGLKYVDFLEIRNLDAQFEYNWVRPYTYTHGTLSTSYTHYNQSLAHPLGANFHEFVMQLRYQLLRDLSATTRFTYAVKGTDDATSNWGGNIFTPLVDSNGSLTIEQERGNEVAQGIKHRIALFDLLLTYQLRHNLNFDLNIVVRKLNSELNSQDNTQTYVGFGLRLNIPHKSYGF